MNYIFEIPVNVWVRINCELREIHSQSVVTNTAYKLETYPYVIMDMACFAAKLISSNKVGGRYWMEVHL
jgi:hypothetical protein